MSKWLHFVLLGILLLTPTFALSWDGGRSDISETNNNFAFDLYKVVVRDSDENVLFSPYSISQAGAMLYGGARTDTASQMSATLHYTLDPNELAQRYTAANESLSKQGANLPPDQVDARFQLNIVNGIWAQQGYGFSADYLDLLSEDFGAMLEEADFISDPEGMRQIINDWISEQTADKLQDIVPPGALDPNTRMVLANAIYMNATWQTQFVEGGTADAPFTLINGDATTVAMMHQYAVHHNASITDDYAAIALPYLGSNIEMIVIVPTDLAAFEEDLDTASFAQIRQALTRSYLNVALPKFEFKSDIPLKNALQELGMVDAFAPNEADFSGMTGAENDLYVSNALHSAYINVDENGTEAAAVTVFSVGVTSAPVEQPQDFVVDRPFIFAIYDHETDLILFLGRVTNPNQ